MKNKIIFVLITIILSGCASMKPSDFAGNQPIFVLEEFFTGKALGQGLFFDRGGNVKASFTVELEGSFDQDILTLKEILTYGTGEVTKREFKIKKVEEGKYVGEAPGFIGPIVIETKGNAAQWKYRLQQPVGSSTYTFRFNDWMFLMPDGSVLNRAEMYKFGVQLGEVVMSVRKTSL